MCNKINIQKKTLWTYLKIFYIIIIIFQEEKKIFTDFYVIGGGVKNQLKIAIFEEKDDHLFEKIVQYRV